LHSAEIASLVVFFFTFIFIITEKIHRTTIALAGAVAMVITGKWLHFYSEDMAFRAIDFDTIGLLLGMMLLLVLLQGTGFFQYVAIRVARISRGNPLVLLVALGTATTVLSMFLNNVTTVVLIAPITILITSLLGISPVPYLIAEALLSGIGGVATLVGDPPNIMIGSAARLRFMDFIVCLSPQVLVAWLVALGMLMVIFRGTLARKPRDLDSIYRMDISSVVKDRKNAKRLFWIFMGVIILFFLSDYINLKPSLIALLGASIALLIVRPKVEEAFKEVELPVLLFFISLFIIVGGLEHSGVLKRLAGLIIGFSGNNLLLCSIVVLWGSAIASAIIDNIPFTMAMIPVIQYLESQGITVAPLWWALALGVGLGGNGLPIGSTANIVVIALSEKTKTPITTTLWMKSGLPIMVGTCLAVTATFLIMFRFLSH
jgi:Na+/H+ antiporter NhaD/arsenite permease-like protein